MIILFFLLNFYTCLDPKKIHQMLRNKESIVLAMILAVNKLTLVAAASDLAELSDRDSKRCNMAHLFLNTPCNNKNTIEDQTNTILYV